MANWAKLQEDLTGLKVVKRAKHGIHFDKGGGEVLANFSGKPCHFLDGKIWKPIDTKLLLLPDGFYGCPHSPVKVSKDGRVKVEGSDYQQFTELPSAKAGVLDGDRIVREFPGGKQYLYVTENGFKEEIVVEKPTFPLEKFIAKTSGALPSKYKESPLTAVDAKDNSYEFTGDVTEFGKWLDKAVYPVVIDPDFTGTSTAGDVFFRQYDGYNTSNFGQSTAMYFIYSNTALFRFDLSSISSSNTATAVSLAVKILGGTVSSDSTFDIYSISEANGDWIEGTGIGGLAASGEPCFNAKKADGSGGITTAWAGGPYGCSQAADRESTLLGTQSRVSGTIDTPETFTETFNESGIARVTNWFSGTNTNYGLLFIKSAGSVGSTFRLGSSENPTESYRPVLSVTYTTGSTGVPKQYLHYARLRG